MKNNSFVFVLDNLEKKVMEDLLNELWLDLSLRSFLISPPFFSFGLIKLFKLVIFLC